MINDYLKLIKAEVLIFRKAVKLNKIEVKLLTKIRDLKNDLFTQCLALYYFYFCYY